MPADCLLYNKNDRSLFTVLHWGKNPHFIQNLTSLKIKITEIKKITFSKSHSTNIHIFKITFFQKKNHLSEANFSKKNPFSKQNSHFQNCILSKVHIFKITFFHKNHISEAQFFKISYFQTHFIH